MLTHLRLEARDPRVRRSLAQILRGTALCSIATVGTRHHSHIHTAYFAFDTRGSLVFFSYPDSVHARNLHRNSTAAIAVFDSDQRWGGPDRGVQMFGTCREVGNRGLRAAEALYGARFQGYAAWKRNLEAGGVDFPLRAYRFVPRRIKLFDERVFGAGVFVEVQGTPALPMRSRPATGQERVTPSGR